MKRLLILGIVAANGWCATLGVPNIILPQSLSATPEFIRGGANTNKDQATTKMLQQQITNFSAQVRGSIIQSNYFQVVDVDGNIAKSYLAEIESQPGNSSQVKYFQEGESTTVITESGSKFSVIKPKSKPGVPDYLLIGTLAAMDAHEEINPITDTNRYSVIYSIDLAVDYKLISTKDDRMIASFTAAGHSGDVKLVTNPNQKTYHNIPNLVNQVGAELAKQVMNQLNLQLQNGKVIKDQDEPPKVSDVKVYSN